MGELLDWLGRFDAQLYLAVTSSRNPATAFLALALVFLNAWGAVWWLIALAVARGRGLGRRGLHVALTVGAGLFSAWAVAEALKPVFARARPFTAVPGAPALLVPEPSSFSFPSGDAAFAMGAAVALGTVVPRLRWLAVLLAAAVALARVAVGVHYPADALAGALVGAAAGAAAPRVVGAFRRRSAWRAFVVAHTHWDREWYERFEGYRARLVPMVTKLLALLERDERFRSFTFDGQTIAIEDHLAVRPEDRPRIEALVRADRLLVGPWYVLSDLLLVSGESHVRNLQEGLRVAGSLGRAMRVAYVADPFGHPAQMPQLLRGFGYQHYVFARGVGDEGEELGSEFRWEAPSGDRVVASHQVAHYSNALALVGPPDEAQKALRDRVARVLPRIFERTAPYANGGALLFMVGDDHTEAYERLPEALAVAGAVMPRLDARIASLEEYAAALPAPRGVFAGEMVSGKYRPILRGVNSTRGWIKQENAACERLLLQWCEPLDALAGGGARDEVRSLWRTLLENHPHDSICGCSIDAVHDLDMAPRFARVRRGGEALADRLAASLAGAGDGAVVWNALPWERDAVVELAGRPSRVHCAALGVSPARPTEGGTVAAVGEGVIENEHLRVEVAADGSFVVIDRGTGLCSGRANLLVDDGDRGDEYTYSYAGPTVTADGLAGSRRAAVLGDRAAVTVEVPLRLPAGLRADRLAREPETVECPIRFAISLDAGARRVDVTATVTNRARDHRLRVVFETGTRTLTHVAGAAFAWLERPNRVPAKRGWVEPPTETRCFHDFIALRGSERGLAVGADGLREYAVLHDGARIALTLVRAVGWLSRGDLPERAGHAGPELATPSAQGLGELAFRYCVVPLDGGRTLPHAAREIREFLSPPRLARGGGTIRSFLALGDRDTPIQVSSLRATAEGALAIRLFNPWREAATTTLTFARPIASARAVDLREGEPSLGNTGLEVLRTAAPLDCEGRAATVRLQPYEIGTWLVTFA